MNYPGYSYPTHLAPGLFVNVLFGGQRSFHEDGMECIGRLRPPLRVLGEENIPQTGPCLITFNHYYRPGFNAWWMALGIASQVRVEMHWVMTGELTFPGKWYAPLGMAGSRWLLKRFAHIYGFTTMPPMPPRPKDVELRAGAVRRALGFARHHPEAIIGLAPEGGDQPGGLVNWPPTGAGRFILLLAGQGFRMVPVGCFEEAGAFCLRFGAPYVLTLPGNLNPEEKDRRAACIVMSAIAAELPLRLRGEFK
jgi:1-acyl-sn-glycerol-3-phosphate acyltransferase